MAVPDIGKARCSKLIDAEIENTTPLSNTTKNIRTQLNQSLKARICQRVMYIPYLTYRISAT